MAPWGCITTCPDIVLPHIDSTGSFYFNNCTFDGTTGGITISSDTTWVSIDVNGTTYMLPTEYTPEPETKEQAKARRDREQEYQQQQEELRKEQEAAVARAEELLRKHIGAEAFGELHKVGYIELDSHKYKGRRYRVPADSETFIEVLDKAGKVVDTLCVHTVGDCPMPDKVLARIVRLQLDEENILEVADSHGPRGTN